MKKTTDTLPRRIVSEIKYDERGMEIERFDTHALYDGDIIRTKEQIDASKEKRKKDREEARKERDIMKQQERQEQGRGKHFVKCYVSKMKELVMLKPDTAGDIIDLIVHLKMNTAILVKGGNRMTFKDIQGVLGKGETQTRAFLKEVGEDGFDIIRTHTQGTGKSNHYSINPAFHKLGKDEETVEFVKLYKMKYQELTKNLKQKEKGILYKIIPHFHMNQYVLCKNPTEPDEDKIEYFGLSDLAEAIGVKKGTASKYIRSLMDYGIVALFETGKMKAYVVHPDLVFRKDLDDNEEYTDSIRKLFEQNMRFAEQLKNTP